MYLNNTNGFHLLFTLYLLKDLLSLSKVLIGITSIQSLESLEIEITEEMEYNNCGTDVIGMKLLMYYISKQLEFQNN